jgi:hypothetical protein
MMGVINNSVFVYTGATVAMFIGVLMLGMRTLHVNRKYGRSAVVYGVLAVTCTLLGLYLILQSWMVFNCGYTTCS